jgi:hypothetical protein
MKIISRLKIFEPLDTCPRKHELSVFMSSAMSTSILTVMLMAMSTSMSSDECYLTFVMFSCVIETGPRLGLVGSNLIDDGVETSQITSIYDALCKNVTELICDV